MINIALHVSFKLMWQKLHCKLHQSNKFRNLLDKLTDGHTGTYNSTHSTFGVNWVLLSVRFLSYFEMKVLHAYTDGE